MKNQSFLILRHRDRAIFERDADGSLHRVEYVPRRWWQFCGRFVDTGEEWFPFDKMEYDVVARWLVIDGCKIRESL